MLIKKYKAPAAEKMLDIIELLTKENKYFSVTEISQRLGLTSNSVFRIMKELEDKEYIERNAQDSTYQLTAKLYFLGSSIGNRLSLHSIAAPSMERLSELTRETTLLTRLGTRGTTLLLHQLESPEPVKFLSAVGVEYASHCSALGKSMLAFSSPTLVDAYLEHHDLQPVTRHTITEREAFLKELEAVRQLGWATDMEESCEGLRCIGAPIRNPHGEVEGAIGISGPIFRMSKNHIRRYAELVMQEARYISELLGYQD
ncbi:IclR family transcriptional regulator [Paenibacillus sp. YYML68]|uniref:IclR family transcriptional regulator n=1 Tax=Paenibacillus sp. YYML68 TaxID=2909250 RepID=UPI00248F4C70|nr:IclR family transcriptional regulator [Paenibacillus sp. YYML68]